MQTRRLVVGLLFTIAAAKTVGSPFQSPRAGAAAGSIEVLVQGPNGTGLEGASVALTGNPYSTFQMQKNSEGRDEAVWVDPPAGRETRAMTTTDRNGRAVFNGIGPGNYEVAVTLNGYATRENDGSAHGAATAHLSIGDPPLAAGYPRESHPLQASIRLKLVPQGTISGRVLNANGEPTANASVSLLRTVYRYGQRYLQVAQSVDTNDRGEYRIFGIPAGGYYVRTSGNTGNGSDENPGYPLPTYYPGTNEVRYAAPVVVKEGQELGGINLDIMPAARVRTVSGTVVNLQTGGVPQGDGRVLRSIDLYLIPERDGLAEPVRVAAPKAGLNNETPEGRYQLASIADIRDLRGNDYLQDIRQDGRSIYRDGVVTVGAVRTAVELVVNRNGGLVRGTVDVPRGGAPAGISVVLVPDVSRRANLALYKFARMDSDGSFNFNGVAPGNYKVFAFEVLPRGAEQNPEFLAQYEQLGIAVTSGAGMESQVPHVPIIRPSS